jgi:hypothetical protein
VLACAAVALAVIGLVLWWSPPQKTEFPPAATAKSAAIEVPDRSETLTGLLLAAALVLLAIAANGRRLTSIKVGAGEVAFSAAESAGAKAAAKATELGLPAEQRVAAVQLARGLAFQQALVNPVETDTEEIAHLAVENVRGTET